jgi:hypothetical protein
MKKSNAKNEEINSDDLEVLSHQGVVIQKSNIGNYKLWMKKPFTGWIIAANYEKDFNYKELLIQDCHALKRAELIDGLVENQRDFLADLKLQRFNKVKKKKQSIYAKKATKK